MMIRFISIPILCFALLILQAFRKSLPVAIESHPQTGDTLRYPEEKHLANIQQLTFGGATLTNIGPGATFTQTVTVLNESTVATPSSLTDIALWSDLTGTSLAPSDLGAAMQVTITRSIGGGVSERLYEGSVNGLSAYGSFASPVGSPWISQNGGAPTGETATSATYTFTFTLPDMRPLDASRLIKPIAVVDLPEPDSPTTASVSPRATLKDTSVVARTKPSSVGKATFKFFTSR